MYKESVMGIKENKEGQSIHRGFADDTLRERKMEKKTEKMRKKKEKGNKSRTLDATIIFAFGMS